MRRVEKKLTVTDEAFQVQKAKLLRFFWFVPAAIRFIFVCASFSVYSLLCFIFCLALGYWLYPHLLDNLAERAAPKERTKAVSSRNSLMGSADQIRSFYELYTKGVLTAEEYEACKREIITHS